MAAESDWSDEVAGGGVPWGWVALIACVFVAGIVWSLVNVNRADSQQKELMSEAAGILEKDELEEKAAEQTIADIERAVRSFYDSRSIEEMLGNVRQPERVAPLMDEYYEDSTPKASRVVEITSFDPLTVENRAVFWLVASRLESGEQSQLLVEATERDGVKIDWETFVCYQPMDWDEFATTRPEGYEEDFRVYVENDHFYSHEFADSETFASFRLSALDGGEILTGYARLEGDLAKSISDFIDQNDGQPTPMILRLKVPEAVRSPRGVEITSLVCPRWLYVEDPEKATP